MGGYLKVELWQKFWLYPGDHLVLLRRKRDDQNLSPNRLNLKYYCVSGQINNKQFLGYQIYQGCRRGVHV